METIQAIFMGIMQGLTEFLPISSSGHLVLVSSIYKVLYGHELLFTGDQEVFLDIILHLGSLLAVFMFFWQDIVTILREFNKAIKTRDFSSPEAKLPIYLVVGTFFTVLLAFPLKEIVEKTVASPFAVGCFLIVTGFVLLFSENLSTKIKHDNTITMKKAIIIGLAQGIAAFPGLSRSGMTMAAGLLTGLDRVTSARYSFLLSILVILGTSMVYPLIKFSPEQLLTFSWNSIIIGFFFSWIVGYFCIKYFLQFLQKYSLRYFATYCFVVGLFMSIAFHFVKV